MRYSIRKFYAMQHSLSIQLLVVLLLHIHQCPVFSFLHHSQNIELKCQLCDTVDGDTDCFLLPNKIKYSVQERMGALGWPICYTIKSEDRTVAQRGMIQEFDGTSYWKPNFSGCKDFYDENLGLKMKVCLCFTDNCNNK